MPPDNENVNLPWWTWIAPFFLILIAKLISAPLFYYDGFFYLYGSYVAALPLYFMWGSRVFIGNVVAESLTSNLTGIHSPDLLLVHGLANAAKPFIGYEIYKMLSRTKLFYKSNKTVLFLIFAIFIPALLINPILISLRIGVGDFLFPRFVYRLAGQVLRDSLWGIVLSYPFLVKVAPRLQRLNLSHWPFRASK
jgi:hypothetical protein